MRKTSVLFVFCLLLASCEKNSDNLTVLLNQSGTLSIKVIDENQSGFQSAKVSIFSSIPKGEMIYYDSTNLDGICNIGKVLQGQYYYSVYAQKENKTYSLSEHFQVIAGDSKEIEVNPFLNVGDARVMIVNANSVPISDINVALIPHPNYTNYDYYYDDLIDEAYTIVKTDSEGWVEFQDMPVSADYSIFVYYDMQSYDYPTSNNYVSIRQDSKRSFTIKVDL